MSIHGFEKFEGLLNATASQVHELSTAAAVSIKAIYQCTWALHRYVYSGSPLVQVVELDPSFKLVERISCRVDEQAPLMKLCKDLVSLTSRVTIDNGQANEPQILLSDGDISCCEKQDSKHKITETFSSGLVAMIKSEGQGINLTIFFNHAKLDERGAVSYWHTFDEILQNVLQDPNRLLGDVDFLSNHDRNQIIQWNSPLPGEPSEQTVCSNFDSIVRSCPDAPAIFAWDGELNYAELDTQATLISFELRVFGVSPGNIVSFCMEKSKWAVVAALAVLKAGAALAPMDSTWPRQRLVALLGATEATVALCSNGTKSCFDGLGIRTFELPLVRDPKEHQSAPPLPAPSSRDVSFILFSSGSTGTPKGMVREHGATCIASIAHAKAMHLDANSRVLQFANHVFDVAMLDFFTTLIVGGCICIPSEVDRKNNLAAFIQRSQANWALLTPTIASLLDPSTVPSLRDVTLGGEAISSDLLEKWLAHCRVGINYGSAEVDVTHTRDVLDTRDPTNVGKRLSSCVTYIVDPNNVKKILPIGATGELLISGPTMARSYLKQPDRTAASFIPAPVDWYGQGPHGADRPHMSRAYRMGDLLQQQWDGSFRFVGRRDFQVKIYGQKVELGEIESRLSAYPPARLCAVLYPRSGPFSERLVAVIEPREDTSHHKESSSNIRLESVKSYLSRTVTSYMLPQVCLLARSMPLTATLKVDRVKLMSWLVEQDPVEASGNIFEIVSKNLQGSKLSSEDQTALKLAKLVASLVTIEGSQYWHDICGRDNVLSQIGLDSVQIMRLSHEISKTFARKVPVETLTDHSVTIKRLSDLIDSTPTMNGTIPAGLMTGGRLHRKLEQAFAQIQGGSNGESTRMQVTNGATASSTIPHKTNVFLTGATGFLGIQILRALMQSEDIGKVYVLVRGIDVMRAQNRLSNMAEAANWSIAPCSDRLEIWPGDLSQPCLGLEESKWTQLTQPEQQSSRIRRIVHCGAVVDWTKSYEELEAANVTSTIELLNAAIGIRSQVSLTYISGGQYFRPDDDERSDRNSEQTFEETARSTGYAQTKLISEMVVEKLRRNAFLPGARRQPSLSLLTIKPAYLMGTAEDGIASVNDYLWRVVAAAVQQKSYNADEDDQWLLAADVGVVARIAVDATAVCASSSLAPAAPIKILHGISIREFWSIVSDVAGCRFLPMSSSQWMASLKAAMESDSQHVLWPLLDSVEKTSGRLTDQKLLAKDMDGFPDLKPMGAVVRKNVEYLVRVGFVR